MGKSPFERERKGKGRWLVRIWGYIHKTFVYKMRVKFNLAYTSFQNVNKTHNDLYTKIKKTPTIFRDRFSILFDGKFLSNF